MTDHEPQLLTIDEAAAIVRAPIATLRYWRHLGTGPRSFRLGRRVGSVSLTVFPAVSISRFRRPGIGRRR